MIAIYCLPCRSSMGVFCRAFQNMLFNVGTYDLIVTCKAKILTPLVSTVLAITIYHYHQYLSPRTIITRRLVQLSSRCVASTFIVMSRRISLSMEYDLLQDFNFRISFGITV